VSISPIGMTNFQFPMLNSYPKQREASRVRAVLIEAEAIRQSSLFFREVRSYVASGERLAIRQPLLDGCALSGLHSRPLIFG